jgi:hypothetical protein
METTTGKDINTSSIESAEISKCRGNLTSVGKFDRPSSIRKRIKIPPGTETVAEFVY